MFAAAVCCRCVIQAHLAGGLNLVAEDDGAGGGLLLHDLHQAVCFALEASFLIYLIPSRAVYDIF